MTRDADATHRESNDTAPSDAAPTPVCPPFDPRALARRLAIDGAVHWGLLILVVMIIALGRFMTGPTAIVGDSLVVGVIVGWIWLSSVGARAAQQLPIIARAVEIDPAVADTQLAAAMRRPALPRSVRLMLYAHLAGLRHHQDRSAESAAICQAVLSRMNRPMLLGGRLGRGSVNVHMRVQLLLLLAESQLNLNNLAGAHLAIAQLHQTPRTLVQTMQMTALQTQYEVSAGYFQLALNHIEQKIRLAEAMPWPQCGAMHVMLAAAAHQAKRPDLADWLSRRAKLLCTADQLKTFSMRLVGVESCPAEG